jgi:hypothetical protein
VEPVWDTCDPFIYPQVTYSWETAVFDDCMTNCGTEKSTLTRDVKCMGSDGAVAADEWDWASICADTKPDTDVVCSAIAACLTYAWDITVSFDDCPTDCDL